MEQPKAIDHIHSKYKWLYDILLGLSVVIFVIWIGSFVFKDKEGYTTNVFTEAISVIATILVIDRINQRNAIIQLKQRLFQELRSSSTSPAINALHWLKREGWIENDYFRGKDLRLAFWEGGFIGNLDFEETDLSSARFRGCTNLDGALFHRVNFKLSNISSADFSKTILIGSSFEEVFARSTDFEGAALSGTTFKSADLANANFKGAHLASTNLEGANLIHADLSNVEWAVNSKINPLAVLPDGSEIDEWEIENLDRFTNPDHPDFDETIEIINSIRKRKNLQPITDSGYVENGSWYRRYKYTKYKF